MAAFLFRNMRGKCYPFLLLIQIQVWIFVFTCFLSVIPPLDASEFPKPLSFDLVDEDMPRQSNRAQKSDLFADFMGSDGLLSSDRLMDWNSSLRHDGSRYTTQIVSERQDDTPTPFSESSGGTGDDDEIDIDSPGLDMGDYPNSAFTLRKGRTQLEMGPASFRTQNANNSSAYATPFLLRYGLTNDVELRLLGTGLTSLISPNEITGFGVLTFDTKIHLWDADMDRLVPAVSFEASIQSQIGSPAFRAGIEPGLFINMDFPLSKKTNFEATLGFTGNQTNLSLINFTSSNVGSPGSLGSQNGSSANRTQNIYAASFQWAVEQEITEKFSLFVHGYYARPVSVLNENAAVIGMGFFHQVSKRWMLFGSANAGLTSIPAPFLTQLGIGTQF